MITMVKFIAHIVLDHVSVTKKKILRTGHSIKKRALFRSQFLKVEISNLGGPKGLATGGEAAICGKMIEQQKGKQLCAEGQTTRQEKMSQKFRSQTHLFLVTVWYHGSVSPQEVHESLPIT